MQTVQSDISKTLGKRLHVKLAGGREVEGILKGYDSMNNFVLDDCNEIFHFSEEEGSSSSSSESSSSKPENTRKLGLVICRGTSVVCTYPEDGATEIPCPYNLADDSS